MDYFLVPAKEQGQLCNLTTGTGTIESIRHTILKEEVRKFMETISNSSVILSFIGP